MAKQARKTRSNPASRLGKYAETGGPGRKKGSKNLTSREAQEKLLGTVDKLDKAKIESGPDKGKPKYPKGYFYFLAEDEPKTFAGLFGRCLPRDMTLDASVSLDWEGLVKAWNRGKAK